MLKIDKCPLCGGELTYKMRGFVSCPKCRYKFSRKGDAIVLDVDTPKYIAESLDFIREFNEKIPALVLSPFRLFEPGFSLQNCVFTGTDTWNDTSKYLPTLKPNQIFGMKLIAAKGILADGLFDKIRYHMDQNFDNPLLDTYVTPEQHFATKLLMVNDIGWKHSNCNKLAEAYIQPNLEGLFSTLHAYDKIEARYLGNDDLAIYSYLYCEPHKRYDWIKDVDMFAKHLLDDLKYRALMLSSMSETVNITDVLSNIKNIKLDDRMGKEFLSEVLKSCPCTAVNSDSLATVSSHTLSYDNPLLEFINNLDGKTAMEVLQGLKLSQALYLNLQCGVLVFTLRLKCRLLEKLGLDLLDGNTSSNYVVAKFWNTVYDEIKDKDVL